MLRSTVSITITATLLALTGAATAQAANPCTSDYMKFREAFDKNGAKIAQGICSLVNKQDPEKAKKCLADFDAAVKKANDMIAKANQATGDSSLTIGPRPLGEGIWKTGALQGQRTWVSPPVVSDTFRVQMERTGGKADTDVTGTVCFLDADGNSTKPPVTFKINQASARFDQTFTDVAGLSPVVLLSTPLNLIKAHQYRIMGQRGGTPQVVVDAQNAVNGGVSLRFSNAGPIAGMTCTNLQEASDPQGTWGDNFFCSSRDIGLRWSSAGPIAGLRCTQVNEPAEPASTTWNDNYLCLPAAAPVTLQWSYAGTIPGKTCVAWNEGADPHTWNDNYACY